MGIAETMMDTATSVTVAMKISSALECRQFGEENPNLVEAVVGIEIHPSLGTLQWALALHHQQIVTKVGGGHPLLKVMEKAGGVHPHHQQN